MKNSHLRFPSEQSPALTCQAGVRVPFGITPLDRSEQLSVWAGEELQSCFLANDHDSF